MSGPHPPRAGTAATPGAPGPIAAPNIVLVGYRGCGKTRVGRELAARLGWTFVDTDERIAAAAGCTIRAIFEQEGEAGFRRREAAVLAEVARGRRQVISAGGGAVLAAASREALRAAGVCVWLTAPPEELWRRVQADPASAAARPPLTAHGGLDEVRHLLAQRAPLYAALADHVIETAGKPVARVAQEVLDALAGQAPAGQVP